MRESLESNSQNVQASIVLPVYNGEKYLPEALASMESQIMGGPVSTELVIVLDGSTDESYLIAQGWRSRLGEDRVHIEVFERNVGQGHALNKAMELSRGPFTIVMNHDDIMLPERIERQVAYLQEHEDVVLVGGQIVFVGPTGKERFRSHYPTSDEDIRKIWLTLNPLAHPAVAHRRNAIFDVGGYRQDEWPAVDLGAWYRLGLQGKIENLPYFVTAARLHAGRASNNYKALMVQKVVEVRQRAMHEMGYHFTPRDMAMLYAYELVNKITHMAPPEVMNRIPVVRFIDKMFKEHF